MAKSFKIKDIEKVVNQKLKDDEVVEDYTTKSLLNPGENYGSLILAVTLTIKNTKTNEKRSLEAVGKVLPASLQLREIFNVGVTVKREIIMYTTILEELKKMARSEKFPESVDFTCDYYGSRISLNQDSSVVDDDTVLLLENLKESGYEVGDRFTGFDLETTKIILKDLAVFHALPIVYRLKKPKEFEEKLKPLINWESHSVVLEEDFLTKVSECIARHAINENPKLENYSSRIQEKIMKLELKPNSTAAELFETAVHLDLWVNNVMLKYEDGVPVKSKILDFQLYSYSSLARDLLFFLFSSVQMLVLEKHFDELIKYYLQRFTGILETFGCHTKRYTIDQLFDELKVVSETEIAHVLFMFTFILLEKGTVDATKDVDPIKLLEAKASDEYKSRLSKVIELFIEKQWI